MAENLFGTEVPANQNNDSTPYTLGTRWTPAVNGTVTHLRMYRHNNPPTGNVTLVLFRNSDQAQLATVVVAGSALAAGWNQVALTTPIAVTAGTAYTAAYFTNDFYVATNSYPWPKNNGANLVTPNPGGFYNGNFTIGYPNDTFSNGNYFADLVFEPAGAGTTPFTKDWSTTWNIRNSWTKDWSTTWRITNSFTKDWSDTWRITNAWTKDYSTTWAISNAWVKDYADTWRIRNAFTKDWASTWAIRAGFTKDWSDQWRIRNAFTKDWASTWRILNGWQRDYSDTWRVFNAWSKDWSDTYNVLSGTAWVKDWADTWRIRNAWTKDYASTWRVLNGFTKDWSDTWVVRTAWQKDYTTTWDILADTSWFKDWSSTWRIRNGWLKDYVTTWRILDATPTPALPADVVARLEDAVSARIVEESVRAKL